eukprot:16000018-Heterocapsa_arctica.AAC.1
MENNMGPTAGPWLYIKDNQLDHISISSERAALNPPPGCWADIGGESPKKVMVNRRQEAFCRRFNKNKSLLPACGR